MFPHALKMCKANTPKTIRGSKKNRGICFTNCKSYLCGLSREILGLFTNVTLASIFRHKGEEVKKLGSASDCLKNAKQSGESLRGINLTIPKFALALLNYEQGRTKTHL